MKDVVKEVERKGIREGQSALICLNAVCGLCSLAYLPT